MNSMRPYLLRRIRAAFRRWQKRRQIIAQGEVPIEITFWDARRQRFGSGIVGIPQDHSERFCKELGVSVSEFIAERTCGFVTPDGGAVQ